MSDGERIEKAREYSYEDRECVRGKKGEVYWGLNVERGRWGTEGKVHCEERKGVEDIAKMLQGRYVGRGN